MPLKRILSKREKLILYICIGVVVFGITFRFILHPVILKYSSLNQDIRISRSRLVKYRQILRQKDDIRNKYSRFDLNLSLSEQPQDTYVAVLSEIEHLSKTSGIRIIDVRPQDRIASPKKEIIIDLRIEGTLEGYMRFIYDVENSLLLLRIRRLQLSVKPASLALEGSFSVYQFSP